MKRVIGSVFAILGAIGVTLSPSVSLATTSVSLPGIAGAAWIPSESTCFSTPSTSNRVTNTGCSGGHAWLVPMSFTANSSAGSSLSFAASGAGSGTAAQCKYVVRATNDTSVSVGSTASISGSDIFVGSFVVGAGSVNRTLHMDCVLFQNGFGLTAVTQSF